MRSYLLLLLMVAVAACKPNSSGTESKADEGSKPEPANAEPAKPVLDTPMKRDLDRICNAEEQSGALDEIPSARGQHVGVWLATNLESQEARTLSSELVALAPPERIAHLKTVLKENQMSDCEIIATW